MAISVDRERALFARISETTKRIDARLQRLSAGRYPTEHKTEKTEKEDKMRNAFEMSVYAEVSKAGRLLGYSAGTYGTHYVEIYDFNGEFYTFGRRVLERSWDAPKVSDWEVTAEERPAIEAWLGCDCPKTQLYPISAKIREEFQPPQWATSCSLRSPWPGDQSLVLQIGESRWTPKKGIPVIGDDGNVYFVNFPGGSQND